MLQDLQIIDMSHTNINVSDAGKIIKRIDVENNYVAIGEGV